MGRRRFVSRTALVRRDRKHTARGTDHEFAAEIRQAGVVALLADCVGSPTVDLRIHAMPLVANLLTDVFDPEASRSLELFMAFSLPTSNCGFTKATTSPATCCGFCKSTAGCDVAVLYGGQCYLKALNSSPQSVLLKTLRQHPSVGMPPQCSELIIRTRCPHSSTEALRIR